MLLPGTSFLEKDGTFANAERRINRVRPVMPPKTGKHEWQIMDEIAITTPTFAGVSFGHLDRVGSVQWPCNEAAADAPIIHNDGMGRLTNRNLAPRCGLECVGVQPWGG